MVRILLSFINKQILHASFPSDKMFVYLLAIDDVVWVGEGTAGVRGAGKLDEREATGKAVEPVLRLADVGHLPVATEVAAEVLVAGARGDAAHEKPAVIVRQPHRQ